MDKKSSPTDFLAKAQRDRKLSNRVLRAVERGNRMTAEEILEVAQEFGYTFTQGQLEKELAKMVSSELEEGGEGKKLAAKKKPKPRPPMSSCAKGCVSWTTNWHPVIET